MSKCVKGLYALTPDQPDTDLLANMCEQALSSGVSVLQYRNKTADAPLRHAQASKLSQLCQQYNAVFIINDHVDLALAVDADGVHVGAQDESIAAARYHLGVEKIIGVSCYNQLQRAIFAAEAGADYVAFGAFYSSATKPNAVPVSLDILDQAKRQLTLPVVAIGGINLQNADKLIQQGCDAIAVCGALFHQQNIMASAQAFCSLLSMVDDNASNRRNH